MGRGAAFPPRPVGLEPGLEVLEASPGWEQRGATRCPAHAGRCRGRSVR